MKILIFLPLAISFYFGTGQSANDHKTYYYFCISHSMPTNDRMAKQLILITGINRITCDEKDFTGKAKDWRNLVDIQCKNSTGCTSDLNYYPDETSADIQLENAKKRFSDTSRYTLSKVTFQ